MIGYIQRMLLKHSKITVTLNDARTACTRFCRVLRDLKLASRRTVFEAHIELMRKIDEYEDTN